MPAMPRLCERDWRIPPPRQSEPSQAATSAPSSSAGSERQPPGLPPANVEVEEAPPSAIFPTRPLPPSCIVCGSDNDDLGPCDYCNGMLCFRHVRVCFFRNDFISTQPSKRLRSTRYDCDGLFCPNHEFLHNRPAQVGDIVDDGDDPGSSDKDSSQKRTPGTSQLVRTAELPSISAGRQAGSTIVPP